MIHHEGTKGTKDHEGFRFRRGALDPDNTDNLVVAPLPDGLRARCPFVPFVPFVPSW
jgi:hypothetical protein